MATLTGNLIRDTYDGLLKTTDSTQGIPSTGQVVIQDGIGNNSALKLGRSGNGVVVDSDFEVQNNLSVNNESQFDQYANFDGQVEMQDNLDVYGDLSAQAQFDSRGIQDTSNGTIKRVYVTSTGVGINEANPNRNLHVEGNSRFNGNILVDKSNSKIGIRRNDPQHPLDVFGRVRSRGISVGSADSGAGSKLLYVETQPGNLIGKYTQMDQYGQGNFQNIDFNSPFASQRFTASYSSNGVFKEDLRYYYIRIKPSFYQREIDGQYKEVTLFNFGAANSAKFQYISEIRVLDNKSVDANDSNYPPRRGNFVGPDADPWISFSSESGAYGGQIGQIPLSVYRKENKKWCYNIIPECFVPDNYTSTNNVEMKNLQRSGSIIKMKVRAINDQPIRPNYDVLIRLTLREFNAINDWQYEDLELS